MGAPGPTANGHANPSSEHRDGYGFDSGDEYLSEDELLDSDLNVLNTDYALQRDLTFNPTRQYYNPSIPPGLRHFEDTDALPEEYRAGPYETSRGPLARPPRNSSLYDEKMYNGSTDYRLPHHDARAYQTHRKRRPLIDLIRNEWQHTTSSSPSSPGYSTPNWIQVMTAPRIRRYIYVILVFLTMTWGPWHYWVEPTWDEHKSLTESIEDRMRTGDGWFGINMRPEFLDLVQVKTLKTDLIPDGKGDKRRLIVVGDVHGCNDELVKLLSEVQYEARTDHLIFAGDFISKGPSSRAVVELAMSAHASCVRGNHEDRVLLAYRDMYSHRLTQEQKHMRVGKSKVKTPDPPASGMPEDMHQNEDETPNFVEDNFEHGDVVNRELARSFSKDQIDWMAACPVILDVGQIKGMGDVHVVHAGLVPGVRLERQDPMGVMYMRTIDLETHVPSSSPEGIPWFKLWNKYQTFLPSQQRSTVIYGHDSRRGLQLNSYSKGLDTGCVKGGKLTAMILDEQVAWKEPRLVSVQCKDYRALTKEEPEEDDEQGEDTE
ncbi:hypothetical protein P7C71_g4916, partial [Lecanoromycetidae sp. Uapishka_2]